MEDFITLEKIPRRHETLKVTNNNIPKKNSNIYLIRSTRSWSLQRDLVHCSHGRSIMSIIWQMTNTRIYT
jgi:hypothetical protein